MGILDPGMHEAVAAARYTGLLVLRLANAETWNRSLLYAPAQSEESLLPSLAEPTTAISTALRNAARRRSLPLTVVKCMDISSCFYAAGFTAV